MRLFKVGNIWYADLNVGGGRVKRSTRCTDKKAAEIVARQWERDLADPDHATTSQATLGDALKLLVDDRKEQAKAGRKSSSTVSFYEGKVGHWGRVLETDSSGRRTPFPLAKLEARDVDSYISTRREEGVTESTIHKELTTLRAALRLAKRAGIWKGDVAEVLPVGFAPQYKPRERALTPVEARILLDELTPDRAARVAFIIATSANWNESELARRLDVADDKSQVVIRGTKRAWRHRIVPIVASWQRELLDFALAHAKGPGDPMFNCWENVRRDLDAACLRIETRLNPSFDHGPNRLSKRLRAVPSNPFPSVSPNDLRRTCATWLRAQGVPPHLIAPVMGHKDSRMVERVYGRLPIDDLAKRIAQELRQDSGPSFGKSPIVEPETCVGTAGQNGDRCDSRSDAMPAEAWADAAQ
jgi:integrase